MAIQEEVISAKELDRIQPQPAEVDFPNISANQLVWADVKDALSKWRIWLMLAYQDIKLRYRRSILGPFWLTISMAITVYTMGFLYGHLFHSELKRYYPFLVAGMLTWSLISTILTDLTDGFTGFDALIKQVKLPYTLYVHRITARNIIIFFHNLLVMVPIFFIYHHDVKINWHTLLILPGLLIIYLNALTYGLSLAIIGARYRDFSQVIKSLIQVIFFVTPVLWGPEILSEDKRFIIDLNPFYGFIELIRAPLIGGVPTVKNFIVVAIVSTLGMIISFFLFRRYRGRIVYWL